MSFIACVFITHTFSILNQIFPPYFLWGFFGQHVTTIFTSVLKGSKHYIVHSGCGTLELLMLSNMEIV